MATASLGLIGHPVTHSKSDRYHNHFLSQLQLNERYEKHDISLNQLKPFLEAARKSSIRGLSVTMPFKECIIPLLDEVDHYANKIGAINTVKFAKDKLIGYNTDVIGAMNAIKHCYQAPLADKKALIVGAGGVAKAIAYGLSNAGIDITIANRTLDKASHLAKSLNAKACPLSDIPSIIKEECDLLIQATPAGMSNQDVIITPDAVPNQVIVFDVVSNPKNGWLEALSHQGNLTISGQLFWIFQAIEQYNIWYDNALDLSNALSLFQNALKNSA